MMKPKLLNPNFIVNFYNGGFELEEYGINNILIKEKFHCSEKGKNKALCLQFVGKNSLKFTLTNISLLGPNTGATAPIETALLWVSSNPISEQTMEKFKDFKKEDFNKHKYSSENDPIIFMQTNSKNFEFKHEFKGKFPVGSYIGILFISTHGPGTNVDVETLGLIGYDSEQTLYQQVGEIDEELGVTRKTLKACNEFTIDLFDFLDDETGKLNFFLFTKNQKEIDEFRKFAESGDFIEFNYFYIDPDDNVARSFVENLGIRETPFATIFNYDLTYKYGTNDISTKGLTQFIHDFKDKKLITLTKSQKRPLNDQDPLHQGLYIITTDSFKEIVLNDKLDVFLDVYTDWCGPCVAIKPIITILAEAFYQAQVHNVIIGKMNSDYNDLDRNYLPETSIPNLKLFRAGKKDTPLKYQGQRTLDGILNFIYENSMNKFDKKKVASNFEYLEKEYNKMENGNVESCHSKEEFNQNISKAKKDQLIVIDFTASWCPPCKAIAPKYLEFSLQYTDVLFLKIDVDEVGEIAEQYNITSMPTFKFLKNENEIHSFSGADVNELKSQIEKLK